MLETLFAADPSVEKTLVEEDGIWLGEEMREIVLKVSAEVAGYFKRRKLIANQVIEKELEDGGLLISAKVGHLNQVLPIVRYWIPHLRAISPEGLQANWSGSWRVMLNRIEEMADMERRERDEADRDDLSFGDDVGRDIGGGAAEGAAPEKGTRIYQTDSYGRVQHNQPSWVVKDGGRLVEVSPYGREQPQQQQYVIEGNRVYHADFADGSSTTSPRIRRQGWSRDPERCLRPSAAQPAAVRRRGSKVYAADPFGRPKQQAFRVEKKVTPGPKK